jgi:hypothetical protein
LRLHYYLLAFAGIPATAKPELAQRPSVFIARATTTTPLAFQFTFLAWQTIRAQRANRSMART